MKTSVSFAALKPPKAPGAPKLLAVHIRPARNGGSASYHFRGGGAKQYVFPNTPASPGISKLLNHLDKHGRSLWLGSKTMEPRLPGTAKAHRIKQIEASSYPASPGSF